MPDPATPFILSMHDRVPAAPPATTQAELDASLALTETGRRAIAEREAGNAAFSQGQAFCQDELAARGIYPPPTSVPDPLMDDPAYSQGRAFRDQQLAARGITK